MSFDCRDIRPSMDVYTLDNVYLGTVLDIITGPVSPVKRKSLRMPGRRVR